jgi:hypothetical protein
MQQQSCLFFLLVVHVSGVRQCLWTVAAGGPVVHPLDDNRIILMGGNWRTQRKTCPSTTLSITNSIWTDLGMILGLYGERPATNHLSHGTSNRFVSALYEPQSQWDIHSAIFLKKEGSGTLRVNQILSDMGASYTDRGKRMFWNGILVRSVAKIPHGYTN